MSYGEIYETQEEIDMEAQAGEHFRNYMEAEKMRDAEKKIAKIEEACPSPKDKTNYLFLRWLDELGLDQYEAARLWFLEQIEKGYYFKLEKKILFYNEEKKYWAPLESFDNLPFGKMDQGFIRRYTRIGKKEFYQVPRPDGKGGKQKEGAEAPKKTRKVPYQRNQTKILAREIKNLIEANSKEDQDTDIFEDNAGMRRISVKNGVVKWDTEKGKIVLEDHAPGHCLTSPPFSWEYDPSILDNPDTPEAKAIHKFLDNLAEFPGATKKSGFKLLLLNIFGYALTPCRDQKVFFVWIGAGDSGKSACLQLLAALLGKRFKTMKIKNLAKGQFSTQKLINTLVIADEDFPEGGYWPADELKTLATNQWIDVEKKFIDSFDIMNTALPIILTNTPPKNTDSTIKNRYRVIPFSADFSKDSDNNRDEGLLLLCKTPEAIKYLGNLVINAAAEEEGLFPLQDRREGKNAIDTIIETYYPEAKELTKQLEFEMNPIMQGLQEMVANGKLIKEEGAFIRLGTLGLLYRDFHKTKTPNSEVTKAAKSLGWGNPVQGREKIDGKSGDSGKGFKGIRERLTMQEQQYTR